MSEIYICVSRTDGSVAHVAFQTDGRFPSQPKGGWRKDGEGFVWRRDATDANIEFELARITANWSRQGDPTMTGWRRLSAQEHEIFNQHRHLRDALEDVAGKIQHNMPKAREAHRQHLRHYNGDKLLGLDREWVNASVAKNQSGVRAVEQKRKALADTVVDPRIDAAQTVEELLQVTPAAV